MTCRPPLSLTNALAQATTLAPGRNRASDGICADARHTAQGTSDHIPDARGIPHAVDVGNGGGFDSTAHAHALADRILNGDPIRQIVTYIIADHHIFNLSISRDWRPYTGPDPHTSHCHISIARTTEAENWDGQWWTDTGDEPLTDDDRKFIQTENANQDERIVARVTKELGDVRDELHAQEQRHNANMRKLIDDLDTRLDGIATAVKAKG